MKFLYDHFLFLFWSMMNPVTYSVQIPYYKHPATEELERPPSKRRRTDSPTDIEIEESDKLEIFFSQKDIAQVILSFFFFSELLNFEIVSKDYKQIVVTYLNTATYKDDFDFVWFSAHETREDRYRLGKVLQHYIEQTPSVDKVFDIYKRFEGMMVRYPVFGAYIYNDLRTYAPRWPTKMLFEKNEVKDPKTTGEYLLNGLSFLSGDWDSANSQKICRSIQIAIEGNATFAAYLTARKAFTKFSLEEQLPRYISIEMLPVLGDLAQAACKRNHFQAMEYLLSKVSFQSLNIPFSDLHPVIVAALERKPNFILIDYDNSSENSGSPSQSQ